MESGIVVEVRKTKKNGNGLFATTAVPEGERIFKFVGRIGKDEDTNDASLQIGDDLFLESTLLLDDYINHSCRPSAYIDWKDGLWIRALKNLKAGDEITLHYGTFSYDLVNLLKNHSFTCHCGGPGCIGIMRGFRYLDNEDKRRIIPLAADHVIRAFMRELFFVPD